MAIYEPDFLDAIEALGSGPFAGVVWRHMLGGNPALLGNIRGARWNPPETTALYASIDRETAIAEGDYLISIQPVRPTAARHLYQVEVDLHSVIDLRDPAVLASLGIGTSELAGTDHVACRRVGGAAAWLGAEGILVPSARSVGSNLVIFIRSQDAESSFSILGDELLD